MRKRKTRESLHFRDGQRTRNWRREERDQSASGRAGQGSTVEAREEDVTQGGEKVGTLTSSWATGTEKMPLDLASRRAWLGERS